MARDDETQGDLADDTRPSGDRTDELAPAAVGQIGRFVVLRRLGSGGMGVVYLAYDNDLDRKLAIKLLRRRHDDDHATALRMQREAQAMARIAHPNVLRVYEVGVADDRLFVAMEYVEGETLRACLARRGPPGDRAALRELLGTFASAGAGLAAAHDAGLVHRDFKPDNVLLDARGGVRVADFGLARAADEPGSSGSFGGVRRDSALALDLTATRAVLGTPAYMAPEQHAGLALGVAADIFAFCVSLHEGLYGVRPFAGDSVEALAEAAAREQVLPAPAGGPVPAWLRAVVLRGLRSDPGARWPSMHALLAALADDPLARRRRRLWIAGGALSLVTAAALVVTALRGAAAELGAQEAKVGEIRIERDEARERAEVAARQARDLLRMAVLRDVERDATATALILSEVEDPAGTPGWLATAQAQLHRPVNAAILRGDGSPVLGAAFVGDGEHVAVHTRDGRLRLFRRDGRGRAREHDLGIGLARLVRLGRDRLAAPRDGQRIGVWRFDPAAADLVPLAALEGAPARTDGLSTDLAGRRLVAVGTRASRAVAWDVATGARLGEYGCTDGAIIDAVLAPDGGHLLLVHDDARTCVVDLDGAEPARVLRRGGFGFFAYGAGEPALLFDNGGSDVVLWPWRHGERPRVVVRSPAPIVRWAPDPAGRFLAGNSYEGHVYLHDLAAPVPSTTHLGRAGVGLGAVVFSPDGAWLAVGSFAGVTLWRTDALQRRAVLDDLRIDDSTGVLGFSDDARHFLSVTGEGDVHLWDLGAIDRDLHLEAGEAEVRELREGADGRLAAFVGDDIDVWTLPGGPEPVYRRRTTDTFDAELTADATLAVRGTSRGEVLVERLPAPTAGDARADAQRLLRGHGSAIWGIDLSDDARWALSCSEDTFARVWDLRDDSLALLLAHPGPLRGGVFAPDARRAAIWGEDGGLRLWDLADPDDPRAQQLLEPDREGAYDVLFSPDGRWLLALGRNADVHLWDIAGERPPQRFSHDGWVMSGCWDPQSRWLATGGADGVVRIVAPDGAREPLFHRDHGRAVDLVACAPDGRSVAAATGDGRIRLWPSDRSAPAELHRISDGKVSAAVFSADGRHLLLGTDKGVLTRWTPEFRFTADPQALLAALQARTTACLTVRQREWLLREPPDVARARFTACECRFDRGCEPAVAP